MAEQTEYKLDNCTDLCNKLKQIRSW